MTRLIGALLLATAILPHGALAQSSAFAPDTVLMPTGGPRILVLGTPGEGVAALRLAVPLTEGRAEAGAGQILRALALHHMETLARPVGVRVHVSRTPWGLAYEVEGAAADFEYLAYLLREAVAEPDVSGATFGEIRMTQGTAAARALETPGGLLMRRLRAGVAPGLPPMEGTPATVDRLDGAMVRSVWRRSHQASAMTLVVAAPVVPEVVLAATRGLGAPEADARGPLDAPAPDRASPDAETLRAYYGEAFPSTPVADALPAVAAILVAHRLGTTADGYELGMELWELPNRWALVVTGRAYPRRADAMRSAVSGAMAAARDALNPDEVERAVAQVRRDVLLRARTAGGLVAVVGRAAEAEGDARAAAATLDALDAVDVDRIRSYMNALIARGPVKAEVRP
jgi:predicted Zn-dependent peptidase